MLFPDPCAPGLDPAGRTDGRTDGRPDGLRGHQNLQGYLLRFAFLLSYVARRLRLRRIGVMRVWPLQVKARAASALRPCHGSRAMVGPL